MIYYYSYCHSLMLKKNNFIIYSLKKLVFVIEYKIIFYFLKNSLIFII